MKIWGVCLVACEGATAFEAQLGPFWVKLLRPRFWCRRNLPRLIRMGKERP